MSQTASAAPSRPSLRPVLRRVVWAAPLAGLLGAAVNMLIWWLLRGDFADLRVGSPGQEAQFWPGAVVVFSLVGALGAGLVYVLLARLTRQPQRVFLWVATVTLLLSLLLPLTLRTPRVAVLVGLELMHVVVFAAVLWLVAAPPGDLTES